MAVPLLETKLHVPRRRSGLVTRPRLSEQLDRAADAPLTLVSAPAGFGKTTLLTEWIAGWGEGRSAAWVALERHDNDPVRFWTYVVAALGAGGEPAVCARAGALLQAPQPSLEAVLGALVNDLAAVPHDVVVVLDDYHVIDAGEVHDGLAFLVEHLPPQAHVVVASRADPPLPLGRLRAAGDLVEIRAADLRFRPDESAAYLNEVKGLGLAEAEIATLQERTEGWIAALHLAALSLHGRDDVAEFIAGFAGDDRYIVDYLVEEVLERQRAEVRDFLLRTCILDRLSGALCDAVTGRHDGKVTLEILDRENLFVVPLDDRRRWYRYHHLFADVLHARLLDEQPDMVAELHRRASDWYHRNGEPVEAVRHALAGEDLERAAELMELALPALRRDRQEAVIRSWVDALPDGVLEVRPVLAIGLAGGLAASDELDRADRLLRHGERWVPVIAGAGEGSAPDRAGMVVADEDELRSVPGSIQMYRAAQALARGDLAATVERARQAIDLAPEGDNLPRAGGTAFLGLASWAGGNLQAAEAAYRDSMVMLQRAGHDADVLGCALTLADVQLAQGRLAEATRTYERGLAHGTRDGGRVLRGTPDMHVGLCEVYRERDDMAAARQHLVQAKSLGEHMGLPQYPHRWRVAEARILQAEQDLDGALSLLEEAGRVYAGDFSPEVRPIPALLARLQLAGGDVDSATGWVRGSGLTLEDEPAYLREFAHLTLARVALATCKAGAGGHGPDEVLQFLGRLLRAAEEGGRGASVVEILGLQALAHDLTGDKGAALACLRRAATLAEPEGFVRLFADEGPALASMLRRLDGPAASPYLRRLVAAVDGTPAPRRGPSALVDPLSERELEVLRLLGTELGGPDIARELVVSLNTVRTHTKHIYTKLGVNNRRAAVREGQRLGLLE